MVMERMSEGAVSRLRRLGSVVCLQRIALWLVLAAACGAKPALSDEITTNGGNGDCDIAAENSSCSDAEAKSDVGSSGPSNLPSDQVGNPINLMTGNKFQKEVDFAIPGATLSFNRLYNSANGDNNVGLGQGWHHSYAVSLFDGGNGSRDIVQSNGSRIHFTADGTDEQGRSLMRGSAPHYGYVVQTETHHEWHLPDSRTLVFQGSYLVRIDWPDQRRLEMFYRGGRLHTVTDETGRLIRFEYHAGVSKLGGYDEARFGTQAGHLASVTLPDSSVIEYDYDNQRNLSRVRYPDGTSREYHYEDELYPNHLTGLTDRRGVRFASWSYDSEGRAVSSEHAGGVEKVTLQYPEPQAAESGALVETLVSNSLGAQSVYTWQKPAGAEHPQLLSSTGAGCTTCPPTGLEYAYDDQGRLIEFRKTTQGNAAGLERIVYHYDEQSRLIETLRTDATGLVHLVERVEFDSTTSLIPIRIIRPSVKPGGEQSVEVERNSEGLPVKITERGWSPTGNDLEAAQAGAFETIERFTTLSYQNEKLVAIDGPRTDVEDITRFAWDERNRLVRIETPESPDIKIVEIDVLGRVTRFQVGVQSPVSIGYDENNTRVVSVEQLGRTLAFLYDAESRVTGYISPDGQTNRILYNEAGKVVELVDAYGRRTQLKRDSEGRRIGREVYASDGVMIRSVSYLFDALGRLSSTDMQSMDAQGVLRSQVHQRVYGQDGQLATVQDQTSGEQVTAEYNVFGELASITEPSELDIGVDGSEAERVRRTFEYDAAGNEAVLTDSRDNRTVTLRDDFGRVVVLNSQDTGITRYRYDAANNRIEKRDASGAAITYRWDAANRMTGKSRPDGEYRYHYSPEHGKLVKSQSPGSLALFEFDREARLIRHERRIDDKRFVTGYEYSDNARLVRKILPDGQVLRYHYRDDESGVQRGTLKAITRESLLGLSQETLVSEIDQEASDGITGHNSANGLRTQSEFAADGSIKTLNIDQAMRLEYEFDESGRIVGIDVDGTLQQYQYSTAGLRSADLGGVQYRYDYDTAGNRVASSVEREDGSQRASRYTYAQPGEGNRLLQTEELFAGDATSTPLQSGSQRQYNASGAPVARGGLTYEYDSELRPVRVLDAGVLLAEYRYNGFGERIRKVVYSGDARKITYYLYDGNQLTAEIDGDSEQVRQGVFLGQTLVAYLVGHDDYAVHGDHLGTPRLLTGTDAETVWSADYAPFGNASITTERVGFPYRLPGQYFDAETGTHYNYYRDYDPATGRYSTSDPIGLKGGLNTYAYVQNDPLGFTDVLGLANGDMNINDGQSGGGEPQAPVADESTYADRLGTVIGYAIDELSNRDPQDAAIGILQGMLDEIGVVAGVVAAFAAAQFAGYGAAATAVLTVGGWLLAGYAAGQFLFDTISMAVRLGADDGCDDTVLRTMGTQLANSIGNLGQELASSVLLGALGRLGGALEDARDYASDGAWALWRQLRDRFGAQNTVAGLCSFDGSTLVSTRDGYKPIAKIEAGADQVWSRDEHTGTSGWRDVVAKYSNRYKDTVHVTAVDRQGRKQTIKSNRIHPFFARIAAGALIATSGTVAIASEGHVYAGEIAGGAWVDAQHLQVGDELLSSDNQWQQVESVQIEAQPLDAYNLTVDEYSTYFVAGDKGADAVWVHNRCLGVDLPTGYQNTHRLSPSGHPIYEHPRRNGGAPIYLGNDGRYYDVDPGPNGVDGPTRPPSTPNAFQNQFATTDYERIIDRDVQEMAPDGSIGDAARLRRNMIAVGVRVPSNGGNAAHHIVPKNPTDPVGQEVLQILEGVGVNIDEAVNGVFLPCATSTRCPPTTQHNPMHTSHYFLALRSRLQGKSEDGVRAELFKIAQELTNGNFTYTP